MESTSGPGRDLPADTSLADTRRPSQSVSAIQDDDNASDNLQPADAVRRRPESGYYSERSDRVLRIVSLAFGTWFHCRCSHCCSCRCLDSLEDELADVLPSSLQALCKVQPPETLLAPMVVCRRPPIFSRHEPAKELRDRVLGNRP